jgi:heat induced stress protein YflT
MTTKTITGLYDTYDDAAQTVRDLAAAGIPDADISLVANNVDNQYVVKEKSNAVPDAEAGAAVGTVLGGSAGLLAGLGLRAIPGVGPVVAAGWLVSTAVGVIAGASAGAATGGSSAR